MKRAFMGLVFFFAAQPALATCHHFSHWAYPWSQRCGVAMAHAIVHRPLIKPASNDWYVEIAIPPELLESIQREEAIEKLKKATQ
jgi:hypothetical protein